MTTAKRSQPLDRLPVGPALPAPVAPPSPGALRTWIGKPDDRFPFPEYVPLDECPRCGAMVLTATAERHEAYHLRNGHL